MSLATEELQPQHQSRPLFGAVAAGVFLVVGGILWMLDLLDVIDVRFGLVLPIMLAVLGLVLMIGSRFGSHGGLITAGVFLAIFSIAAAILPPDAFRGGIGERNVVVSNQADLESRYDLGIGEMEIDLSDLSLTGHEEVVVSVGMGQIVVRLPDDLAVDIQASVGIGSINLPGSAEAGGFSRDLTFTSPDYGTASDRLRLDLSMVIGSIEVKR